MARTESQTTSWKGQQAKEDGGNDEETEMQIPEIAFNKEIREAMQGFTGRDLGITPETLLCLQEAAEAYLVQYFDDAMMLAKLANRTTLLAEDMRRLKRLRENP